MIVYVGSGLGVGYSDFGWLAERLGTRRGRYEAGTNRQAAGGRGKGRWGGDTRPSLILVDMFIVWKIQQVVAAVISAVQNSAGYHIAATIPNLSHCYQALAANFQSVLWSWSMRHSKRVQFFSGCISGSLCPDRVGRPSTSWS